MAGNSFGARSSLEVGGERYEIHRLDAVDADLDRFPYSLKILLENLLRNEDGDTVTREQIEDFLAWDPNARTQSETLFTPARVLLQDFTGVPAIVDFAAMRDAIGDLGGDPDVVDPALPADLVIDHSVIAEVAGVPEAFVRNAEIEFHRNIERYRFLRWGQEAFNALRVVPPSTGIVHQVNLEYLAQVVFTDGKGRAYPDTLVGLDSHTPMINGLGVLGWGVGGIEAEAAMLGQPISMLVPKVVGLKLSGELPEGTTATDLVLTITELLRSHGVVGKFVEFYGPGVAEVPLANRATIGNMSPEYGSTAAIFPIDDETLRYLEFTGRPQGQIELVERYAKEQGLFHDPSREAQYSEHLELDLSTVVSSLAGPSRPQDRVALTESKHVFRESLARYTQWSTDEALEETFPASDTPTPEEDQPNGVLVETSDGEQFRLSHGDVVIAAITSCTNTSNPQVMLGAGLLAKNAVDAGLESQPWVKTSLAPGSKVVMDYYRDAGLLPYLEKLGFNLVGFGCTTCVGNSGPLSPEISQAVRDNDLTVVSVLSGNRNFEGRINPDVKMNYLASPPLVVAYAIAGSMDVDLYREPLGRASDGSPIYLADIWPSSADVEQLVRENIDSEMFRKSYANILDGDERWQGMDAPSGDESPWDPNSTYVQKPPFFDEMGAEPEPVRDISGARVLAKLGDSVTTDHISPAGAIVENTPAGQYLLERGVEKHDFNSYGARRGNHEVMMRGTFANVRLRNQIAPGTEGGVTLKFPEREQTTIYDAAMRYQREGTPLVVLGGKEYGSGSSRDWAAKGPMLLGVRAVLVETFERIHRSNLIGMGVLPLEFPEGESAVTLGLTGEETFEITGLEGHHEIPRTVTVRADGKEFEATVRIDTALEAAYYRHGGILHYVLRRLRAKQ
ncbi:aconitate hydratase AcnA [Egibacter rhizosphaerae]|uniref:Aconitate hydratase n=1 Tax=Egibacter rhizosphaerae TaxID=1670831 RepID=A0A411YLF3_9ACTN|nr:aconitate hydratase AcnA [Egibacter rhizosphaerae]